MKALAPNTMAFDAAVGHIVQESPGKGSSDTTKLCNVKSYPLPHCKLSSSKAVNDSPHSSSSYDSCRTLLPWSPAVLATRSS